MPAFTNPTHSLYPLMGSSKITNAGFSWASYGPTFGYQGLEWDTTDWRVVLLFGSTYETTRNPIITPEEAWNIDTKMDDGQPDQGRIQGGANHTACYTAATAPAAEYALTTTTRSCMLILRIIQ